ncbi:MAG: relaxase/mobilization nuclease domain-containing protein [Desulfovibrio sp.]|uniref:relaxase/mobilization nuclease domain-containing protein n=1 Tax=Desulfovibrio sp. 7SRBS1 TaxID=3378064 RepID=UPI003B3DA606
MYMKVFPHGKGSGAKAVNYVIDPGRKGREHSPPQVLRGDPQFIQKVIGSTDRKWKYTSGVLSWAPEDKVSEQVEAKLMDDFERTAFAGMESDQYAILWVRHSHAGHHELHFIIPRTELRQDKAFNPCSPGWQKQYDVWRDLWNDRMSWARPDDPNRSRIIQPGNAIQFSSGMELADFRKSVTDFLVQGITDGLHQNRDDLVKALQNLGFSVPRQGKEYITLELPQDGKRVRMKGGIYAQSWSPERTDGKTERAYSLPGLAGGADRSDRIERLERELAQIRRERADYHQKRYGRPDSAAQAKAIRDVQISLEAKFVGESALGLVPGSNGNGHNRLHDLACEIPQPGRFQAHHRDSPAEKRGKQNTDLGLAIGEQQAGGLYYPAQGREAQNRLGNAGTGPAPGPARRASDRPGTPGEGLPGLAKRIGAGLKATGGLLKAMAEIAKRMARRVERVRGFGRGCERS